MTKALRAVSVLGAAQLAMACSVSTSAASQPVELKCSVRGAELVKPENPGSICARFKAEIDRALAQKTHMVSSISSASQQWLKLDIAFTRPGTASARLTHLSAGQQKKHPEIAIDVMDKPLGQEEVQRLAHEVAKLVAKQ